MTGANTTSGDCVTDTCGHCGFSYFGTSAGTDIVEATATANGVEVSVTREVEWVLPPENDEIEDAVVVGALPFEYEQTLTGASKSVGEPDGCGFGDQTVWFEYTPEEDEFVSVSAMNPQGEVAIGMYESVGAGELALLGCSEYVVHYRDSIAPAGFASLPPYYVWLNGGVRYNFQLRGFTWDFGVEAKFALDYAMVGDATCDSDSDTADALAVLQHLAYGYAAPCIAGGDVNCDGAIETIDALEILRRVAGLSSKVGCG